jgi:AcrR family transcriptional regulator
LANRKNNRVSPQREKMLAKASTLFWEKGYGGTSMRDIAKCYGCKPANIYNFFKNKEEILFEFLYTQNKRLIEMIKHFEDDRTTNPRDQLREFIFIHLNHSLSYQKTSRSLFDSGLERLSPANRKKVIGFRDIYDRILSGIIQRGMLIKEFGEIDAKLAARNIASMIVRTIIWFSPKGQLSVNDIADFIFKFSLNGLRGQRESDK